MTCTQGASSSRCGRRRSGFALVAVMLIGAMASVVAATVVTVAVASAGIAGADRRAESARAAADAGLADVLERLAWGQAGGSGALVRSTHSSPLGGAEEYIVGLTLRASAAGWPRIYDIDIVGTSGAAQVAVRAVAQLQPTRLPCGVAVAGQITCSAPTTVSGCGVYVGADVRGREHISFAPAGGADASAAPPPDGAHGDLWPSAGVHANGRIYNGEAEEHAQASPAAADTDACTGGTPPPACTALPADGVLADLRGHGAALSLFPGESLDLTTLAGPASGGGLVVVVRPSGGPLHVTGWRPLPPLVPQLTLVVIGDASIVAGPTPPPDEVSLAGELVVTGTLAVETPTRITGSLMAGALAVNAPLVVDLPSGWRDQPSPGCLAARAVAQW